jgi:hypothetical protein
VLITEKIQQQRTTVIVINHSKQLLLPETSRREDTDRKTLDVKQLLLQGVKIICDPLIR